MLKGLYTAYTGMTNEQRRLDIMTNNLANATTVGFKKEGSTSQAFNDILAYKLRDASVGIANVQRIGVNNPGVKIGENYTDYGQGSFRVTENALDLAISGEGFFAVEFTNKADEVSTKYTRAGSFSVNAQGFLVTKDGDYVLDDQSRRIQLDPNTQVVVNKEGIIMQNDQPVATVGIVDFEDYDYLEKYGETYFQPVEGAQIVEGNAEIYAGYLEMSNVNTVSEMVNLISITRAYETNQKVIQTFDSGLEITVNQLGKVN